MNRRFGMCRVKLSVAGFVVTVHMLVNFCHVLIMSSGLVAVKAATCIVGTMVVIVVRACICVLNSPFFSTHTISTSSSRSFTRSV